MAYSTRVFMQSFKPRLRRALMIYLLMTAFTPPFEANAEAVSLLQNGNMFASRAPLITSSTGPISMFGTQKNVGFFAPLPPRDTPLNRQSDTSRQYNPSTSTSIDRLRAIIGRAESSRSGYDAVQHAATIKPAKAPTQMTLGEIYKWIDDTPGQHHAIGRYQFIPKTLRRLAARLGAEQHEVFTPELQNALSDILLYEAGYNKALAGQISRHSFMDNLAKIWTGLPTTSGKSHYHGYAGNRASITWAEFEAEMKIILPRTANS